MDLNRFIVSYVKGWVPVESASVLDSDINTWERRLCRVFEFDVTCQVQVMRQSYSKSSTATGHSFPCPRQAGSKSMIVAPPDHSSLS